MANLQRIALAIASMMAAAPALGDKPPPPVESASFGAWEHGVLGECVLGHPAATAFIVHYVLPPNDSYLTLLEPDSCGVHDMRLSTVHARLYFQVPCTQTFAVSIVAAIVDTCLRPDPDQVLCGPMIVDYASTTGTQDVTFDLPSGCAIDGPAFLNISFVELEPGCADLGTRPALVTSNECQPCSSYNFYPAAQVDVCAVPLPGRPIMYVEAESTVPVLRSTWGAVRIRYR